MDIQILQDLLSSLYEINNIPTAILDLEGNILTATALQNICTDFHRINPDTVKKCLECDVRISANVRENGSHFVYRCPMGLMECTTPITIGGEHLGNVFIGQIFMEQPDESYYMMQARQYGYDENKYLDTILKVPVVSEKQLDKNLAFICKIVQMLAEQGIQRKKQLDYAEDLRKSEKKLRIIFDNMEAGIIGVSPLGIITIANRRMAEMFGMSLAELIGTHYTDHLHDSEKRAGIKSMRQIIDGVVQSVELNRHYLRKDGTDFWGHLTGTRFDNTDGSMRDQIIVISDITERKLAEEEKKLLEQQLQQAQKMESLGVLAGGIAHDFNNILTVILGHCYMAREAVGSKQDYKTIFQQVESAANRAADLCRQMLTYSGRTEFVRTRLKIWLLVDEVVNILKSAIGKNVTITLDLKADIPDSEGDSGQIQRIVMNLIINAAEAIGDENGTINVVLSKTVFAVDQTEPDTFGTIIHAGSYACLEVADTGCGMDEETQKRIFEPFYTTKFTGRGLGMSAIRGIVKSHNGALQLTSTPGVGTTFKVYFPLSEATDDVATAPLEPTQSEKVDGTILLVDDEEILRKMGTDLLGALGFSTITAQHGREALEIYRDRGCEIDVILLDLIMPVMGGIEAYHVLRKIDPTVPIVICSGYAAESVLGVIHNDERAGFVQKPYKPEELRDVIVRVKGTH
jgi:PAS domain S-box-containing protein